MEDFAWLAGGRDEQDGDLVIGGGLIHVGDVEIDSSGFDFADGVLVGG